MSKLRPWSSIQIVDCGEALIPIPDDFLRIDPHPYVSLGAPYGELCDPWLLREGVIDRLLLAQDILKRNHSEFRFSIFDAWRPIPVQKFMFEYSLDQACISKGVERYEPSHRDRFNRVFEEVSQFWAEPSTNPETPPPHSTGAAIDLTLSDLNGNQLNMGSEIDFVGEMSRPNYFENVNTHSAQCISFHLKRKALSDAMINAGFVQHPLEWWHFSFGDQLWAWITQRNKAIYSSYSLHERSDNTFSSPS